MPRRVVSDFSKGMITDSVGEEGALAYIQDMYLRKKGELISRGPIYPNVEQYVPASDTSVPLYPIGYSTSQFHPNFGLGVVRGMHTAWDIDKSIKDATHNQLIASPIGSTSRNANPEHGMNFYWQVVTEGPDQDSVCHDVAGTKLPMEPCYQSINTGQESVFAGENGYIYKWAGATAGVYNAGTVSTTVDSRKVVGVGTTWLPAIPGQNDPRVGQYILITGVSQNGKSQQRAFRITAINSNTELEVETALQHAVSTATYRIQSVAVLQSEAGIWNGTDSKPRSVGVIAYHADRLAVAGVADNPSGFNSIYDFDSIRFSGNVHERSNGYSHMDLWHPNGQVSIMPGTGGFIRGLVSQRQKLVVIKSHGLFTVSDTPNYNGEGATPRVTTISSSIGASGFRAWSDSPVGVVMANENGLWVYDGDELQSMTAGRIDNLWKSFAEHSVEYTVNVVGSLVIIGSAVFPHLPCICWDFEKNYFFVASNAAMQSVSSIYGQDDMWIGFAGFGGHSMQLPKLHPSGEMQPGETPSVDMSSFLHWTTTPTSNTLDAVGITSGPKPIIASHPIPLFDEGPGNGRINNAFMTVFNERRLALVIRPGDSGVDQILYSEHQSNGQDFGINAGVNTIRTNIWGAFQWGDIFGSEIIAGTTTYGGFTEEEVPLSMMVGDYEGGYKNVRVPVEGFPSTPFASLVMFVSDNDALDRRSYSVRLQAIYIDYEQTTTMGSI